MFTRNWHRTRRRIIWGVHSRSFLPDYYDRKTRPSDIEAKAIRTYTATLAQSIRTMKFGLKPQSIHTKPTLLHDTLIKLPTHLTSTFKGWKTSSLQIFQKYRTLSTQYFEGVGMPNQNKHNQQLYTLDTYTLQVPLRAATKQI